MDDILAQPNNYTALLMLLLIILNGFTYSLEQGNLGTLSVAIFIMEKGDIIQR